MGISAATLAEISTAVSVGSTVISAVGSMNQGKAEANSANYNAAVARNNQILANQNATLALQQGQAQQEQAQQKNRAEVGGIISNQAASGVDVNSGSAVDVRSSAAELGELNAINLRAQATRTAYGYQTHASSFQGEEGLDKAEASNDITAGNTNAASSILGGIGSSGSSYSKFLQGNSLSGGSNDITDTDFGDTV